MTYRTTLAAVLLLAGCGTTDVEEVQAVDPVGPVWIAQEVAGDAVPVDYAATLQLGEDGRASGKGGCNQYGGSYELAGSALRFGEMISTKMACDTDPMAHEQAYFDALPKVTHYELRNDAELVLLADDETRIVLRRSDAPQP
jgi:putative lipoprotein